jgi:hypothetical protein
MFGPIKLVQPHHLLLKCLCNAQEVARHWRNPVRTRVTPLDSSDALYIVF